MPLPPTHARRGFAPAAGDAKISSDLVPTERVFEMSSHSLPAQKGPRAPRCGRRSRSRQCKFPYRCAWARLQGAPVRQALRTLQTLKVSRLGREVCVLPWRFYFFPSVVKRHIL